MLMAVLVEYDGGFGFAGGVGCFDTWVDDLSFDYSEKPPTHPLTHPPALKGSWDSVSKVISSLHLGI